MGRKQLDLGDGCEIRVRQTNGPAVSLLNRGWTSQFYRWEVYMTRRIAGPKKVYDKRERVATGQENGATTAFQAAVRWAVAARIALTRVAEDR